MGGGGDEYRLGYRADIEGLRAVAILLVIGAHAGVPWLKGGFVGVGIFFVLSGFLITGLLVQEIADTGRLKFADFYIRRLRRLFPALLVMLVGVALLASLLLSPSEQQAQVSAGASAVMWGSNIHFALERLDYFSASTETNIFLHTWSLGVEEQFCLVWPAVLYVLLRGPSREKGISRLYKAMLLVIAVGFIGCIIATYKEPRLAFYMMPMRAWQFAVGALVWLHFKGRPGEVNPNKCSDFPIQALTVVGWLGLVSLLSAGILLRPDLPYPGFFSIIPTLGAACVIAAGSRGGSVGVARWLSAWPLPAIGRISYAWYLWHWPLLLLGNALTGSNAPVYRAGYVAVSLVLAALSYCLVEAPVRRQSWWLTHQRVAIYGSLVLIMFGTFGFLQWSRHAYLASQASEQRQFVKARIDAAIIYGMGCDEWYHSDRLKPCIFGSGNARHTAVLMGDSIAGQWFPAAADLFSSGDWRLVVLTKSSCPMVDEPYFYPQIGREYTECASWRAAALKEVARLRPDVVLISSLAGYGFSPKQWAVGSAEVMESLSDNAGRVYVLRSTPHLPFNGPDCLAEHARRPEWLKLGPGCSIVVQDKQADLVYKALQQAAASFPNVQTLDMTDVICPNGTCNASHNGVIVFRDSVHMTASFAVSLALWLEQRTQEKLHNL